MATQAQLEQEIRDHYPLLFGTSEAVAESKFLKQYNRLVAYMKAVAEPFLSSETLRYQSIVLYSTLIFLAIKLLKLDKIKFAESDVAVDRTLYVLYTIFIALIVALFLVKAWMDSHRAALVREQDAEITSQLTDMMRVGMLKVRIQHYFWLEAFDAIGRAYKAYYEAASEAIGKPEVFTPNAVNLLNLDYASLRKSAELADEIDAQEKYLATLKEDLAMDEAAFKVKADAILAAASAQRSADPKLLQSSSHFYGDVVAAFEAHLRPWFNARDTLSSENLSITLSQMGDNLTVRRANAMINLLKREHRRRVVYAMIEIWTPVAWAVGTVAYVWSGGPR